MVIKDNKFSKDNVFFAEEIIFDYPGKVISQTDIDEIEDFPGKEEFIDFYTAHNGGDFIYGAWFFPEDCYNVIIDDEPYITMGVFLSVVGDDLERPGIENLRDSIGEQYKNYEDFVLFHIPFALDVTDNPFWIDIQTGEIKYTDYEECVDPYKDAITVASSFKNFCKRIKNRDMAY